MKTCTKCGEVKPFSEYNRMSQSADGYRPSCRSCTAEYRATIRTATSEYNARYRQENAEYEKQRHIEYRAANLEEARRKTAAYMAERHDIRWAGAYRERMKRYGLEAVVEPFTKQDVIDAYGDKCTYCESGEFQELDHLTPLIFGGHHTLANVRPSCKACNHAKSVTERRERRRVRHPFKVQS